MKQISLKEIKRKPNARAIEQAEILLEDIKSGRVQGFASVRYWDDESCSTGWAINSSYKVESIIGALHMLIVQLTNNADGISGDVE